MGPDFEKALKEIMAWATALTKVADEMYPIQDITIDGYDIQVVPNPNVLTMRTPIPSKMPR